MRHALRHHVLRYVIVLVALLGGTAAVVPTVSAMQPPADELIPALPFTDVVSGVVSSTLGDATDTLSYWTPERMRAARPASAAWRERRDGTLPLLGLESGRSRQGAWDTPLESMLPRAGETDASSWSAGGAVTRTTGKVFFTLNGSDFVCSGSAVQSANRDTVLTAGHCVNSGPGEFASQWVFVPGYRDGDRPYGTWTARRLFAPAAWTERGDIDHDVGFAVLGGNDGVHLADVVGAQAIAFNAPRGLATYSFGYPALGQYDGNHLVFCRGKVRKDQYGSRDQGLHCDMTDGSSGGPWLSNFDPATGTGVLTSVNSFGYDGMPDVMWGPYLDHTIQGVFAKARVLDRCTWRVGRVNHRHRPARRSSLALMTDTAAEALTQRPASVPAMFLARVAASGAEEAFRYQGSAGWESLTWTGTAERVRALAAGLIGLGVAPEERVAILATTRVEWILADLGILCAGAATTTVYPTTGASEAAFIIADSGSRVVFADGDQLDKLRSVRAELPNVVAVVTFDGPGDGEWVHAYSDLRAAGAELLTRDPDTVDTVAAAVRPEHLATLIYTSGTTGRPKGVQLTHDCWTYNAVTQALSGLLHEDDLQYLWLPLAHSFGRALLCGQLAVGFPIAVDGRVDKIVENLPVVRPTIMAAAPRIFEKVYNRVVSTARATGGVKYSLFKWAVGVGREVSRLRQAGGEPGALLGLQYSIADKLVFSKVRARFGGRLRGCVSGSAPLAPEIAEFFDAAGIPIFEGYGLTETSAGITVNTPGRNRIGTVGPVIPGSEVRIAEDGEIMLRGPGVMRGYHNLPEQTAAVLSPDGWFASGDIGELDESGHLRITDRKKDLIKTSGGKYVAPTAVEGQIKASCPYVSQVLVHGHGRNFCTALISLDAEAIAAWAGQNDLGGLSYTELVAHPSVHAMIAEHIEQANASLERWATIKRFEILPVDLTIEGGELTPSLKLKRRVVEDRYDELLAKMYSGSLEEV